MLWKEKNPGIKFSNSFFLKIILHWKSLKSDFYKIKLTRNFFKVVLKQNKIEHLQTEIE